MPPGGLPRNKLDHSEPPPAVSTLLMLTSHGPQPWLPPWVLPEPRMLPMTLRLARLSRSSTNGATSILYCWPDEVVNTGAPMSIQMLSLPPGIPVRFFTSPVASVG